MAQVRTLAGEPRLAIEHARQAAGTILAYGLDGFRPELGATLAGAELLVDPARAAETAHETIELSRRTGHVGALASCLLVLAATHDPARARPLVEEARQILEGARLHAYLPRIAEAHGAIARGRHDLAAARAYLEDARRAWIAMGATGHA